MVSDYSSPENGDHSYAWSIPNVLTDTSESHPAIYLLFQAARDSSQILLGVGVEP